MNWKFVLRGTLFALIVLLVLLFVAYRTIPDMLLGVPYGPLPRPPAITALRGNMPERWSGLEAYATYGEDEAVAAGSGFVFRLPSGAPVAVAAAHSFGLSSGLESVEFSGEDVSLTLDVFQGSPGEARTIGRNLTKDYVMFVVQEQDPSIEILEPDDRGSPQPGERIVLFPGFGAGDGERWGTILESDSRGVWAVMDDAFEPGMMSGSPIVSLHTGKVVGMALAAGLREGHTVIGMHPIGSLVEKALAAESFIPLSEYIQE